MNKISRQLLKIAQSLSSNNIKFKPEIRIKYDDYCLVLSSTTKEAIRYVSDLIEILQHFNIDVKQIVEGLKREGFKESCLIDTFIQFKNGTLRIQYYIFFDIWTKLKSVMQEKINQFRNRNDFDYITDEKQRDRAIQDQVIGYIQDVFTAVHLHDLLRNLGLNIQGYNNILFDKQAWKKYWDDLEEIYEILCQEPDPF